MAWKMTPADIAALEAAVTMHLGPKKSSHYLEQTISGLRSFGVNIPRKVAAKAEAVRKHGKWSSQTDKVLRENYATRTYAEIATELGISRNAVIGRAYRLGLSKSPAYDRYTQASKARIAAMWAGVR